MNSTDLSRNLRAKGGASGNLARTPSSISAYETLGPMCSSRVSSPSVHLAWGNDATHSGHLSRGVRFRPQAFHAAERCGDAQPHTVMLL